MCICIEKSADSCNIELCVCVCVKNDALQTCRIMFVKGRHLSTATTVAAVACRRLISHANNVTLSFSLSLSPLNELD